MKRPTICHNCDKPDCPSAAANDAFHDYPSDKAVDGNPEWEAIVERKYKAEYVCASNRVNWRERALAVEAKVATAVAYADFLIVNAKENQRTADDNGDYEAGVMTAAGNIKDRLTQDMH